MGKSNKHRLEMECWYKSSDKNAGSINSLSGNHSGNSLFAGLTFPSGGVLVAEGDIGNTQASNNSKTC